MSDGVKKILIWLRDNSSWLVPLLLVIGGGAAGALYGIGDLFTKHTVPTLLLLVVAVCFGFVLHSVWILLSRRRNSEKNLSAIKNLPPEQFEILKEAYKNGGTISGFYTDPDINYLLQSNILCMPTTVTMYDETTFMLRPKVKEFLKEHEEELL